MSPVILDRLYTFSSLSSNSWLLLGLLAGTGFTGSSPNTYLGVSSLAGLCLMLIVAFFARALTGPSTKKLKDLTIHWTNTDDGTDRTSRVGYANGAWDHAVFATRAYKSKIPLLVLSMVRMIIGFGYAAAGFAILPLIDTNNHIVNHQELMAAVTASAPVLVIIILAITLLCARFTSKYAIEPLPAGIAFTAILALADRAGTFLDPRTGRARFCIEMNGHVYGMFRWSQHNSAEGDRY